MNQSKYLVVHGKVQGVWFRKSCYNQALGLGITGWVKNRADGCVEMEIYGSPEAIDAMISWCNSGPPLASVEKVEIYELPNLQPPKHFQIIY